MKKVLSVLLVTLMLFSVVPLSASAASSATEGYYTYEVENGEAIITGADRSISGNVTIPSTLGGYPVTEIGYQSFYQCNNIKSLVIPDSVETIYKYAFYSCSSLESVTIEGAHIWDNAFYNCSGLKNIITGDKVTSVNYNMFYVCTAIESITIGRSVSSINIGDGAFSKLSYISVDNNNPVYSSDNNGVLFNKNKTKMIKYPEGKELTNYSIPSTVTTIGEGAFSFCLKLKNVEIPNSVTSIESRAFYENDGITDIDIPGSVKTIGESAFMYCSAITEISIPDGVTTIGDYAFMDDTSLEKVSISESVTNIGEAVFGYCPKIEVFTVDKDNPNYSTDENGVLFNKSKTQLVQYTTGNSRETYIIPDTVTKIEALSFTTCSYLKNVIIPDSVKIIDDRAFYYFYSTLTDVYYTSSETAWNSININSTNSALFDATIHYNYIQHKHNYNFTAITASTCTSQGYTTYTCECGSTYNDNYTEMLEHNFVRGICSSCRKNIRIASGYHGNNIGWVIDSYGQLTVYGIGAIESAFSGDDYAWGDYHKQIKNIIVEPGITGIPAYAFEYCEYAENIILPETVTDLDLRAFQDCGSLNNLLIPSSVKNLEGYGNGGSYNIYFVRCESLSDMYYLGTAEELMSATGGKYIGNLECNLYTTKHYLKFHESTATCTEPGIQAYYQFEDTSVYGGFYDEDKNPISEPQTIPAQGHRIISDGEIIPTDTLEPQCESVVCHYCGTVAIEGAGHIMGSWYQTKAPTCTDEGESRSDCARCDYFEIADIAKVKHTYSSVKTAPTCTSEGYTTYVCECGDSYVDDYTDKTDHDYNSEITTPATHLEEGVETFTCTCGDTYTEPVAKLTEHTYTSEITKEATHLEEGETTYSCECGDTYTEAIGKLTAHTYEGAVTAPTCTSEGYTVYTCECGDSYVGDYVEAAEHTYTPVETRPATHLVEGIKTNICIGCGDSFDEAIPKTKEHTYYVSYIVEPTCENEGYTVYLCQCDHSYNGDIISATGHDYDGDVCKNCDKSKVDNCTCNCHKGGISGLIWKILRIFFKLFGVNKTCGCGVAHY